VFAVLNDRQRDQILLKRCFEEDRSALIHWDVDSYRTEVIRTIKAVIDCKLPGGLSKDLLANLVIHCTWCMYERYEKLPSHVFSLKTQVQKFAFGYANDYLSKYLRANVVR
jgi:hypothetical protein